MAKEICNCGGSMILQPAQLDAQGHTRPGKLYACPRCGYEVHYPKAVRRSKSWADKYSAIPQAVAS